jgi:hypothetical protein
MGRKTVSSADDPVTVGIPELDHVKAVATEYYQTILVFTRFCNHLEAEVAALRADVDYYRGKLERLEMASERERYSADKPQRPPMSADIPKVLGTGPTSGLAGNPTKAHEWQNIKEKWDAMSAEEQAKALASNTKTIDENY